MLSRVEESADDAEQATKRSRPIVIINDGLRRIFVSRFRVAETIDSVVEESLERFRIRRSAAEVGKDKGAACPVLSYYEYEPFNEFGRRIVIVNGGVPVEQTITEINPRYVIVASRGMLWDMRIATSSLPQSVITRILMKQINPKKSRRPQTHRPVLPSKASATTRPGTNWRPSLRTSARMNASRRNCCRCNAIWGSSKPNRCGGNC